MRAGMLLHCSDKGHLLLSSLLSMWAEGSCLPPLSSGLPYKSKEEQVNLRVLIETQWRRGNNQEYKEQTAWISASCCEGSFEEHSKHVDWSMSDCYTMVELDKGAAMVVTYICSSCQALQEQLTSVVQEIGHLIDPIATAARGEAAQLGHKVLSYHCPGICCVIMSLC